MLIGLIKKGLRNIRKRLMVGRLIRHMVDIEREQQCRDLTGGRSRPESDRELTRRYNKMGAMLRRLS
jgi:hypothetical protein